MARPPRLPKLAIPSPTLSPSHATRRTGGEEKQPLTAVERGRGMVVPSTPVVVPPTPVGGQRKEGKGGKERDTDGKVFGGRPVNEKEDERLTNVNGIKDEENTESDNGGNEIIIVQSPEDEEPPISIHSWNDSAHRKSDSKDLDKTPQPRSPTSPIDVKKTVRSSQERKSPIPTGRSRSRSSASSSQLSGMAPRRTKEQKAPEGETRNGDADAVAQSPVDAAVESTTEVQVMESPIEELVFDSPVNDVASPNNVSTPAPHLAINDPLPSLHTVDPRTPSGPTNRLTKSDSAVPAMRSPSPEQKQIYDEIFLSPAASACETPCLDRAEHRALHRGEVEGFFPLQEVEEREDDGDVAESPGGLTDDEDAGGEERDVKGKERDREAEQRRVDSMDVAKTAALSHSTESLHALRKQSEGFSPCHTDSGSQTPAGLVPGKGKERMLSVDDEVSVRGRGRGGPGHHRRESSTHRVRETLDARHYSSEMGERLVNQYKIQKLLGKGAYGNVYKAIDVGTGTEYALKEFSKNRLGKQQYLDEAARQRRRPRKGKEDDASGDEEGKGSGEARLSSRRRDPLSLIRREIAVMKKLDHPNLVLLYEAIDVPTSDSLYLVLEFMSGGTIMDVKLGDPAIPLDVEVAREYFRQLILGLEYLHENDVAHRDIKPDNILLSASRQIVKLCDFGVSDFFHQGGDDLMRKNAGSPAFMPPEAAVSSERNVHAKAVDIWSLGVTLFCLLSGHLPFEAENPLELYEAIRDKPVPVPEEWSGDVRDLFGRMLDKDPGRRIEMAALREHPWVTFGGTKALPSTEENLYTIGKQVVEPTQEELGAAITSFRQLFTVLKVIQKLMRNVKRNRRTMSNSSYASSSAVTFDSSPGTSEAGTPVAGGGPARDVGYFDETGVTASPVMMPIHEGSEMERLSLSDEAEGEGEREGGD